MRVHCELKLYNYDLDKSTIAGANVEINEIALWLKP